MKVSACKATPYLYRKSNVNGTITKSEKSAPILNNTSAGTSKFLNSFLSVSYRPGFINPIISHNINGIETIVPKSSEI